MALTDLATCKMYLQIDPLDVSEDDFITLLLSGVQARVEAYCKRVFEVATYTNEQHNVLHMIYPNQFPIKEVISISRLGQDLYDPTSAPLLNYRIYPDYIEIMDGMTETMTNKLQYLNHEESYVEISYTAGWLPEEIPADLQIATAKLVALDYKESVEDRIGLESYSEGAIHEIYFKNAESPMPITISSVLDKYKKIRM
jgi:hypothetical protein